MLWLLFVKRSATMDVKLIVLLLFVLKHSLVSSENGEFIERNVYLFISFMPIIYGTLAHDCNFDKFLFESLICVIVSEISY